MHAMHRRAAEDHNGVLDRLEKWCVGANDRFPKKSPASPELTRPLRRFPIQISGLVLAVLAVLVATLLPSRLVVLFHPQLTV